MPAYPVSVSRSVTVALVAFTLLALALAPAVLAEDHEIAIGNEGFDPAELTVVAGEPVTWTNASDVVQSVTSDEGAELDSGEIGPGEAYGHVFEVPGEYAYHSEANAELSGTITVIAAPVTAEPSGSEEPLPPEGTLPPDFSPFPSTGALDTPVPASASAAGVTPAASAAPGSDGSESESTLGNVLVVVLLAAVSGWLLARLMRRRSGGS